MLRDGDFTRFLSIARLMSQRGWVNGCRTVRFFCPGAGDANATAHRVAGRRRDCRGAARDRRFALATDAASSGLGRHTVVRRYALSGKASDAGKTLEGLLPSIEKAPGFVDYSVVDAGGGRLMTVLVFTDRASAAVAAQLETDWIAKHASDLLPKKPNTTGGDAIVTSDLVVGCPCSTGVQRRLQIR